MNKCWCWYGCFYRCFYVGFGVIVLDIVLWCQFFFSVGWLLCLQVQVIMVVLIMIIGMFSSMFMVSQLLVRQLRCVFGLWKNFMKVCVILQLILNRLVIVFVGCGCVEYSYSIRNSMMFFRKNLQSWDGWCVMFMGLDGNIMVQGVFEGWFYNLLLMKLLKWLVFRLMGIIGMVKFVIVKQCLLNFWVSNQNVNSIFRVLLWKFMLLVQMVNSQSGLFRNLLKL